MLLLAPGLAVAQVVTWGEWHWIGNLGGAIFIAYLILTPPIKRDSVLIIGFITLLGFMFVREMLRLRYGRAAAALS